MSNSYVPENLNTIEFSVPYEDALVLQSMIKNSSHYSTVNRFSFSISPLYDDKPKGTQNVKMTFKMPKEIWTSVYGLFSLIGYSSRVKED